MERRGIICPLWGRDKGVVFFGLCQRKGFEMEICRSGWPPKVAQTNSILVPFICGGSFPCWGSTTLTISSTPRVWQTWVTCLLKDLSFACCTPVYLFQGRAASFKLPGKIKLYYSPNMTRGWQAPVSLQSGTQPSGTGNMFLLPAGEERIDPRAPQSTRGMRKQGLISTAWCKTWASPPWAKSHRGVLGLSGVTVQAEQGAPWCWGGWERGRGTGLGFLIFVLLSAFLALQQMDATLHK